ncbi:unnamed protein product [Rhizoctonia solani]|uniref:Uncharacterized protein n=1 Tax=Rhizoctonia solani TaxID=456999 RepID=A0A8H3BQY5_9AGAM|nr:unnamed protein product [Rhizoctonia solani]
MAHSVCFNSTAVMHHKCTASNVCATFNYALPNPNGYSLYHMQPNPNMVNYRRNYIPDPRNIIVHDVRGQGRDFLLDVNGFEYLTHHTNETFLDKRSIETNYYEEVQQLVKEYTGANQVRAVGHTIRQSYGTDVPLNEDSLPERKPASSVHVDRTPESTAAEVKKHMGDDAERLLQGRVRFVNVWRPIGHEVHHEPLALADSQTTSKSDLLPVHVDTIHATAQVFLSRFSRAHTWYYLGHQTPSEITMIKCYDSFQDGGAKFCLHSSFLSPGCHQNAPRRKSIEVNTLVFG